MKEFSISPNGVLNYTYEITVVDPDPITTVNIHSVYLSELEGNSIKTVSREGSMTSGCSEDWTEVQEWRLHSGDNTVSCT